MVEDRNREPQPLVNNQKITNDDGTPTEYFIRWAQERQIAIQDGITQTQLEEYLAEHALQAGTGISITPSGSIADDPTIALDAGLGDLNDVDLSIAPVDGDALAYDAGSGKWKAGAGGGGGGAYHPPAVKGTNSYFLNANHVNVIFPPAAIVGDIAVIGTNHAWDPTIPAGWTALSHLSGTNISGAVFYKVLDAADIAAAQVTVNYSNIAQGCAIIAIYDGSNVLDVVLGSEERTPGPHTGLWSTTIAANPAASLFLYGGIGDYAATVFSSGTMIGAAVGPVGSVASADLYSYVPPNTGVFSGTASHASSINGTYTVCVLVRGISFVEEAPNDGQLYARQNEAWTAFVPGGGGGGGGGGQVSAAWWRIRAISGQPGHNGDGMGFMGVNWRNSAGAALVGTGTPIASRTDGAWNLAQAFDGDVTSGGHGWYSGNGDGQTTYSPWIGYHFLAAVTPVSVEFAPLAAFSWTVPFMVAHEYSTDGENWITAQIVDNIAGASGVVQTYPILPQPGAGGYVKLDQTTLSAAAASITFAAISAVYEDLIIVYECGTTTTGAATKLLLRINGDTGNNYDWDYWNRYGNVGPTYTATAIQLDEIPPAATAGAVEALKIGNLEFPGYARTTQQKMVQGKSSMRYTTSGGFGSDLFGSVQTGYWRNPAAITSITLLPDINLFSIGSRFTLYGRG